ISYIKKQEKVATSFGVDLLAYEGGQHLVDWDTRKVDQHPNPLLYAANRDPRMGIVYDELMIEWKRAGGKLFVAFSAPRIYSWYGSWGIKEHIRQARADAPKYDSLLRYLENSLNPEVSTSPSQSVLAKEKEEIKVPYAKNPQMIWDMTKSQALPSRLTNTSDSDISAKWQANWDSKHLYFSFSVKDNDIQKGDELILTLDTNKDLESDIKEQDKEVLPAKTFTFTPFGRLGSKTHLTKTDTGYLLNVAIPWKNIYTDTKTFVSNGSKIGVNIKVVDVDEDVKARKTLYWADTNEALPRVVLIN
ncbi:MAG: sugar-binding protein, partial [Cocleimonas sp.]